MTSLVRSIAVASASGILVLAGVHSASAQLPYGVEFTTSFPFTVGNSTVPAGSYSIRPDDDNPRILELTGAHTAVLFETESADARETPAKTELVFKRYGDGYVLKDIWEAGLNTGVETVPSEGERHALKHPAKGEERVAGRKKSATSNNR